MSKHLVFRIRWFAPESEDPSERIVWQYPAQILVTLFLNFFFWEGVNSFLHPFNPLWLYVLEVAGVSSAVTALFFWLPMCAVRVRGQSLMEAVERSIGTIPAFAFRGCCLLFLVFWTAQMVWMPVWWGLRGSEIPSSGWALFSLHSLFFLFSTGLQNLKTEASWRDLRTS